MQNEFLFLSGVVKSLGFLTGVATWQNKLPFI